MFVRPPHPFLPLSPPRLLTYSEYMMHPLGQPLSVDTSSFTALELTSVLRKLKCGKAADGDDVSPDFWAAPAGHEESLEILLRLCNVAWNAEVVPEQWTHATVVTLYKKGNTALPENYQPISLLPVAYKQTGEYGSVQAAERGCRVEERLRSMQFGFRAKQSTTQAIFIARTFD